MVVEWVRVPGLGVMHWGKAAQTPVMLCDVRRTSGLKSQVPTPNVRFHNKDEKIDTKTKGEGMVWFRMFIQAQDYWTPQPKPTHSCPIVSQTNPLLAASYFQKAYSNFVPSKPSTANSFLTLLLGLHFLGIIVISTDSVCIYLSHAFYQYMNLILSHSCSILTQHFLSDTGVSSGHSLVMDDFSIFQHFHTHPQWLLNLILSKAKINIRMSPQ